MRKKRETERTRSSSNKKQKEANQKEEKRRKGDQKEREKRKQKERGQALTLALSRPLIHLIGLYQLVLYRNVVADDKQMEIMNIGGTDMNGLQALELMKQGKTIKRKSTSLILRIEDDVVKSRLLHEREWVLNQQFNFQDEYEEYVDPQKTGWHNTEQRVDFLFYYSDGEIDTEKYWHERDYADEDRFSTREKAEEIEFKQRLTRKLQRFSDENGGDKIDWLDYKQNKYFIIYNYQLSSFNVDNYAWRRAVGQVYFASREIAERAINLFHDDLVKYYTKF